MFCPLFAMDHQSLLLAIIIAGDAPPPYFLVTGIAFAALGLKFLYDWWAHTAKKTVEPESPQHLSPAQQRLRARFEVDPRQYRRSAIIFLLIGAFFIGLYLVTSRT